MTLDKEISLEDFGVSGEIFFTPGHTKGSLSILFGNNEAIVGDMMMGGWMGGALLGSRPNYHYFIDDLNEVHASMKRILSTRPAVLYVGHGGPLSYQAEMERLSSSIAGAQQ